MEEYEYYFINEIIGEKIDSLSLSDVKKAITLFEEKMSTRYFRDDDIHDISKNLYKRIQEEVGKNLQTLDTSPISNKKKLKKKYKTSETINAITGEHELNINGKTKTFKDKESLDTYLRNLI